MVKPVRLLGFCKKEKSFVDAFFLRKNFFIFRDGGGREKTTIRKRHIRSVAIRTEGVRAQRFALRVHAGLFLAAKKSVWSVLEI